MNHTPNTKQKKTWPLAVPVGILFLLLASACNYPLQIGLSAAASATGTASDPPSARTHAIPADAGTERPAFDSPPTETIVHRRKPGEPGAVLYYVGDYSSKASSAYNAASGGDDFLANLFERPFTSRDMEYLPEIDILRADIAKDEAWLYVTIRLEGEPDAAPPAARYGVELDTDLDGRGNYLIRAYAPNGTDWSTDGVRMWEDGNADVGGTKPLQAESDWSGDGYETLTFDQGRGRDPDTAWARIDPAHPDYVQLAFLRQAVGNTPTFLWSVWAEKNVGNAEWFDYNDFYDPDEAGSPIKGQPDYPIKALAAVDNTCRMSMGFVLAGDEPGACPVFQPTTAPTQTLTPTRTLKPTRTQEPLLISDIHVWFEELMYTDPCPFNARVWIAITATGSGTVYYDVFRKHNPTPYEFWTSGNRTFSGGGTQTIGLLWQINAHGVYHVQAHITSPIGLWSNEASMSADCGMM